MNRTHARPHHGLKPAILLGLSLCLGALLAAPALGEGFRNPPEGAAALGRVGGNMLLADDATAISHNPANLTDLEKPQAMAALTIVHADTEFTPAAGGASETTESPWKFLPDFYYAAPVKDGAFAAGIGVTTPFGQSTEWKDNGIFQFTAPYYAKLQVININPTFAAKLGDKVSFALGADVFQSDLKFEQNFPWFQFAGDQAAKLTFDGSGYGFGANAAVNWKMLEKHWVAVTYRSPVKVEYDGDFDQSYMPFAGALPPPLNQATRHSDFETEIEFPQIVGLGYAFIATDTLRIGSDAEWVGFSSYDELDIDIGNNNALLPSRTIPQDWKDVWTGGLDVDWKCSEALTLRAGYIFIQSPVPDDTLSPTLPDADRHVVSVGLGLKKSGHSLDLAYAYSFFEDRDIENNVNPDYNGTYELNSQLMGVTYGYQF